MSDIGDVHTRHRDIYSERVFRRFGAVFLSDGDCPMSFDGEPEINGK